LYIVNLVFIFFDLQIHSILQLKNKSRKTKNASKITTNKEEVKKTKEIKVKTKKTRVKAKIIETSTRANARANARATIVVATTTTNKKRLLKSRKQFACTYVSFVFKTTLILLNCLLLFNNL